MSSTEKAVLWFSANLAATGCMSAVCGPVRARVVSVPELHRGLYTHPERFQIYISFKKFSKRGDAYCGNNRGRHAPAPWDPRAGTSKCKCPLSAGGALRRLFIAGHLVKMCPLSSPPCSSLWFHLSLFANVRFYAGRTRERWL